MDLVKKEVGRTVAELPDDPELEKLRFNGPSIPSCTLNDLPKICRLGVEHQGKSMHQCNRLMMKRNTDDHVSFVWTLMIDWGPYVHGQMARHPLAASSSSVWPSIISVATF